MAVSDFDESGTASPGSSSIACIHVLYDVYTVKNSSIPALKKEDMEDPVL